MSLKNRAKELSKKKKFVKKLFNFKIFPINQIGHPQKWDERIQYVDIHKNFFDEYLSKVGYRVRYSSRDLLDILFSCNDKGKLTDVICPVCSCGTLSLIYKKKDIDENVVVHVGDEYKFECSNPKCKIFYSYRIQWMHID